MADRLSRALALAIELPTLWNDKPMNDFRAACAGIGAGACLLTATFAGPTDAPWAQVASVNDESTFVCMQRHRGEPGEKVTQIVVPRRAIGAMEMKGFEEFDCTRGGFPPAQQAKFRDEMCQIAADQPEAMQRQLEHVLGERPAVLCAMAEIVVGEWDAREAQSK